ncbi:MAG TPA: hypothetical protein VGP56_05515 [Gaiellaceae bacterium]|nr:hypothetical protein [Gaiellaceae bacterium]
MRDRRERHAGQEAGNRDGEEREPRDERAGVSRSLQEEGAEEEEAEVCTDEEEAREVGARALAAREQPERRDRLLRACLVQREQHEQRAAGDDRGEREAVGPADLGRADDAVDERGHPERRSCGAGEVEAAGMSRRLGDVAPRGHDQRGANRDVDEHAGAPGEPLREDPAEDETDGGAAARHSAVAGERAGAFAPFGKVRGKEGECRGSGDRGADALDGARDDEHGCGYGEAAGERGDGEDPDACDEDAAAAEEVAGAGAEEEQAAEGERVAILDPRQPGGREAECLAHLRQRGDDDRDVQDEHQIAREDDQEDRRAARFRHAVAEPPFG